MGGKKKASTVRSSTAVDGSDIFDMTKNLHELLLEREASLCRRESQVEQREKKLEERREQEGSLAESTSRSHIDRTCPHISFQDVANALPEFSGADDHDVRIWIQDVESAANLMNWTPLEKLFFSKRLLSGSAKLAVRTQPSLNNWEDLKKFLVEEFSERVSTADMHRKLANRKQKRDESIYEYYLRMRELGMKGNIDDPSIIQYIIDGINDSQQNKVMLYGTNDMKEFKSKLDTYKTFKERNPSPRHSEGTRGDFKKGKCFNCGEKGHRSKDCSKKKQGPRCFNCLEFGHKAPNCPKKQQQSNCAEEVKSLRTSCNTDALKTVTINDKAVVALIDTGSELTLLRADEYIKMGSPKLSTASTSIRGLSGHSVETLGAFTSSVVMDGQDFPATIHVLTDQYLKPAMLIGRDILEGTEISLKDGNVKVKRSEEKEMLSCHFCNSHPEILQIGNRDYKDEITTLITNYKPAESKTANFELRIILKDETPVSSKPRRLSPSEKQVVDNQIADWLRTGIIQPSISEFSSPIVLVDKKDGTKRLCVDFRKLNKQVIRDRFPLPLIDDQLDQLQGARVFSTLDLENGFFHVPVAEDSRKYTAFVTPSGQYEFLRMPFGLCTSPTVFQRYINSVFSQLQRKKHILVYMDDIIILAKDEEEGVARLKETLEVASLNGLRIKWRKCQFLCRQIEYLGYRIFEGKMQPSDAKIAAVRKFPEPKDVKKLQSFLGLSGYFRKFIPNYAQIAKPLSDLLRKESTFTFGLLQKEAFRKIKDILIQKPVLLLYNPQVETELHCDASKMGFGAILLQKSNEDELFHPVYFYSRKTTPTQEKYSSYELEVLSIVSALKKLRVYLLGIPFKIVTDCAAFRMTMEKQDLPPRVARWAMYLQDYNYQLEHRSGNRMKHVDSLSRSPIVMIIHNELVHRIQAAQMKDETLNLIAKILESTPFEDYFLESGILYKEQDGRKLLCVPKGLQKEIIKSVHDQGHFGQYKMEELIKREYHIPKLKEKVESCRKSCIPCILTERKSGKQEGWLNPLPKDELPLVCYHVDHLGPLSTTTKNYKYILTIIDGFSKFTWMYPVKTKTTEEVIEKLEFQKNIFGNPKHVITDRGTAFTSLKDMGHNLTRFSSVADKDGYGFISLYKIVLFILYIYFFSMPWERAKTITCLYEYFSEFLIHLDQLFQIMRPRRLRSATYCYNRSPS